MADHKYPRRFYDNPGFHEFICAHCKHWYGKMKCKAFPDNVIWHGHYEHIEGDHGILYEEQRRTVDEVLDMA